MRPFKYFNAETIDEAVSILREYKGKARIIAGGTDLLGILKAQIYPEYPEVLVNIKTIKGLDYIKEEAGVLKIGALTKLYDIEKSPIVNDRYRALAEAAHAVGGPQIRNMGTIGGNLCQDVRCWYFRYPHHIGGRLICLRKGGTMCYAMAGDNRYHSIFGAVGGCVAVHPSDIAPALIALNAEVETSKRTLTIEEFFAVKEPTRTTVLDSDEILTEIRVPRPAPGARSKFMKFRLRRAIDFAIVNVAVSIVVEGGVCKDARIVLNAVYPTPYRATKAEDVLKGKSIDESTAEAAGEAAVADAIPLSRNKYKVQIAKTLVKRAILACK